MESVQRLRSIHEQSLIDNKPLLKAGKIYRNCTWENEHYVVRCEDHEGEMTVTVRRKLADKLEREVYLRFGVPV